MSVQTILANLISRLSPIFNTEPITNVHDVLETFANELATFEYNVTQMMNSRFVNTAEGRDLDLHGAGFDIPRLPGEVDTAYSERIIETLAAVKTIRQAIINAINKVATRADVSEWFLDRWFLGSGIFPGDSNMLCDGDFESNELSLWNNVGNTAYITNQNPISGTYSLVLPEGITRDTF
jgi:hypothetical protein